MGVRGEELLKIICGFLTYTAGLMVVAFTEKEHKEKARSVRKEQEYSCPNMYKERNGVSN